METKQLTIDINGTCNMSCEFCYQDSDDSILSKNKIMEILDKNPDVGTVEIGGGEPFLHPEIIGILTDINKRNKKIHISTNATEIPQKFLNLEKRLKDNTQVQVSLHASNSELYEEITGKNYFHKALNNLSKLKDKYQTLITSTIYKKNFNDTQNLVNLAFGLGVPIRINLAFPIGKGKNIELLSPKETNILKEYLIGQNLQKGNVVDSPLLHKNNCEVLEKYYNIKKQVGCPVDSGSKIYISPQGKKYACEFIQSEGEN